VTDAHLLQVTQRRNDGNNHFLELVLLPKDSLLLSFSKEILQVRSAIHVLANHGDPVSIVHCLIEVVAEELKHVGVRLHLE